MAKVQAKQAKPPKKSLFQRVITFVVPGIVAVFAVIYFWRNSAMLRGSAEV